MFQVLDVPAAGMASSARLQAGLHCKEHLGANACADTRRASFPPTSIPRASAKVSEGPSAHNLAIKRGNLSGLRCFHRLAQQCRACSPRRGSSSVACQASSSCTEAEAATSSASSSTSDPSAASASARAMELTADTLYELLGLSRTVTQAEIKGAYRQLARRYHPDMQQGQGLSVEECTRRFIEVQEAYEVLSDPQRRAMYDFEMLHGLKRGRGGGLSRTTPSQPGTWRPSRRYSSAQPLWESEEEEEAVKTGWREQWQRQMDGLKQRSYAQPKPESWAARMRKQRQGGECGAGTGTAEASA